MENSSSENNHTDSDNASLDTVSLPKEERAEISAEINRILISSKMEVDTDRLVPQARSSGLLVPLLIIGGLFVASSVFAGISYRVFSRSQGQQIQRSQTFYSADSQLVREILYQSNSRIREKEEEISSIQGRLQTIADSLQFLEDNIEVAIEDRRQELEAQFSVQLAEREQELIAQRYDREEVDRLLAEERRQVEEAIEEELDSLREVVIVQENRREADLLQVKAELESELQKKQDEITELTTQITEQRQILADQQSLVFLEDLQQQLSASAQIEEDYQTLLQQQQRKSALGEQLSGGIIEIINDVTMGLNTINAAQLRTLLRSEEVNRLLGNTRVDANIRVMELLDSYQLLKDQLMRRQEEALNLAALPIITAEEERIRQLQESYLALIETLTEANEASDIEGLQRQKNEIFSFFLLADELFPGLGELFLSFDDRIEELSQLQNQTQQQSSLSTARVQVFSEVETVIGAALGNPRLQNSGQRLIQNDRRLANIYSLVRESISVETETVLVADNSGVFGYVTAVLGRGSFTVNKTAQDSVSLGDVVEVYRGQGRTQENLVAIGIIIRVDGNTIQCQINNQRGTVVEILENDTVYLIN